MIPATAFAVQDAKGTFALHHFERRQPAADDVLVRIQYCGICHTDIHYAHNDFGITQYPLVPGHEIVGVVERIGEQVSEFNVGDLVGVGYMVDSCRQCQACVKGFEQFCEKGASLTYGSTEQDKKTRTQGGYANLIVAKQHFVFKIPEKLKAAEVGPLMCAGISTYSPLRKYRMGKGSKVAIVGLGGLGHMAIKFAVALGADVTVLSTSESKREDAIRLGAQHFIISKDKEKMNSLQKTFNMVLDTVSAEHDVNALLSLLAFEGVYCILGIQTKAMPIAALNVIRNARVMCGSVVGGVQETREMLQFCADHQISCDVEMIEHVTPEALATAYERTLKADVKYRFVIDLQKAFASTAQ